MQSHKKEGMCEMHMPSFLLYNSCLPAAKYSSYHSSRVK